MASAAHLAAVATNFQDTGAIYRTVPGGEGDVATAGAVEPGADRQTISERIAVRATGSSNRRL
jgi:hypothetical protein